MMSSSERQRELLLQEEVRSLSQELAQCQADKEFVWSLWKRLQAANPDLTQAVSLVVEREKQKAEAKDRKVLEILQVKDYKIQELEKEVTSQRQEVSGLLQQHRVGEDERHTMKKELVELQHTLSDTTRRLQVHTHTHTHTHDAYRYTHTHTHTHTHTERYHTTPTGTHTHTHTERYHTTPTGTHTHTHTHTERYHTTPTGTHTHTHTHTERYHTTPTGTHTHTHTHTHTERYHTTPTGTHTHTHTHTHTLRDTTRRLQECDDGWRRRLEAQQEQSRKQEETNNTRLKECDDGWRRRLEEYQEQSRKQEEVNNARLGEVQEELVKVQAINSSLSIQLSSVQQKLSEREQQLQQLRRELQDLQSLYVQSVAHAGEQAELIQQLEGLNMDTQQILQSQEKVHTTHTASYHKLYSELSVSYQALRLSEEQLRQKDACLTEQLCQKEQQVSELQVQLQELQQLVTSNPPRPQVPDGPQVALLRSQKIEQECVEAAESQVCVSHPPSSDIQSCGTHTQQSFRSVSPSSSRAAEKKIQQLEELLALKSAENEELRRAHAKRHDRLRLIQTNYRAVKEHLREVEDTQGLPKGRTRRAEPWELRQENSDAVWNELAFFKRENKKLLAEKAQLEEELDVARVRVAMERATAQELRLRLHEEHQEQQLNDDEDDRVSSTPLPPVHTLHHSVRKIEVLERKMVCLEREMLKLREDKQALEDANNFLRSERTELQAALQQACVCEEATQAWVSAERDKLLGEARALQAQLQKSRRAEMVSRAALLRIRQEVGVLRAERDFHRNKTRRGRGRGTHTITHTISVQPRTRSPAKDEWEDMSPDSDSEDFSDSLQSQRAAGSPRAAAQSEACTALPHRHTLRDNSTDPRSRNTGNTPHSTHYITSRTTSLPVNIASLPVQVVCYSEVCVYLCVHLCTCVCTCVYSCELFATLKCVCVCVCLSFPSGVCEDAAVKKRGMMMKRRSACVVMKGAGVCEDAVVRKRRVMKRRRVCAMFTQRLACLQQQVAALQAASRAAHEERLKYQHTHSELQTLTHTLQKQTCELTMLQQQKAVLEAELERWRKSRPPEVQQQASVTVSAPNPDLPNIKTLETEIKQLNNRLKSSSAEVSRQTALIKGLRTELHDKDQRLKELQDKVCHCERDVVMKRQLVEDLRSRLKILQDSEHSHRSHIDELERKVKSQCEEASNRKSFIESLKRRLSVATDSKQQCESSNSTLQDLLRTKEQKLTALQARLAECERSKVKLEQTATSQMQLLTNQSTDAIRTLQNKLTLAQTQHQHLRSVTLALAVEVDREVRETRAELRKRRRERKKEGSGRGGVSKSSMVKAQSIAASILNVSANDLASILDTDQEEEGDEEADGVWMDHIQQLLEQQCVSAGELLDVLLVKMKENRALMEELVTLRERH
ncbi:centlein [Ictalurus furcatus]|uniref:centlein n=1 Tax=Ictalurus furcatus TaxID=66913 RepID=UPI0023507F1B|nr:centlein [Ictalurus furcatus]